MSDQYDAVNRPKHYNSHPSGVQAIEVCEYLGFNLGNAVKYLFRVGMKGPAAEDLAKACWYLRRAAGRLDKVSKVPDLFGEAMPAVERVLQSEDTGSPLGSVLVAIRASQSRRYRPKDLATWLREIADRLERTETPHA